MNVLRKVNKKMHIHKKDKKKSLIYVILHGLSGGG